ncbi:MAG TPA: GNAT family N-acetyltransferase [Rhodobacteraceae bacterium]|jgi:predicted N-acyltransferase|nr:GNAT family N-acetyltransferase [Paracoccaceae bacterium]
MTDEAVTVELAESVRSIDAAVWDSCACPETRVAGSTGRARDPFTTHRFLAALEESGSVGAGSGWDPRPLVARQDGEVIAVAPLYVKSHSQGEYIFDHSWAQAYERAGGRYYPKLQVAVPFTPVTGRRLLARPGFERAGHAALAEGIRRIGAENGISSAHVTFCTEEEAAHLSGAGFLPRVTQQYHWESRGYQTFDDFLADLSSRKRKAIRKERARAQAFGGTIRALTGAALEPEHWDAMWAFYQDTGARKWGTPYLTRAFFELVQARMRDDVVLFLAERDGVPVAGALNFIGRDTLYGRYWGCVEDHPCLHFELCYYQAIDWALARGMTRVEAGAQGEHKLARGYLPVQVHSAHWIGDVGFSNAVARYLREERAAMDHEIEVLTAWGPFRKDAPEEQD